MGNLRSGAGRVTELADALRRSAVLAFWGAATSASAAPEGRADTQVPVTAIVTRSANVASIRSLDAAGAVRISSDQKANVTVSSGITVRRGKTSTKVGTTIFVTLEF